MEAWLDALVEELARSQHGAFSHGQASAIGFSPDQIQYRVRARRTWVRVGRGVYVLRGYQQTLLQRAMVVSLQLGDGAFASHRFAALVRDMDGVRAAAMEFSMARRLRSAPRGVKLHDGVRVEDGDYTYIGRLPVATATRIVVDLAMDPTVGFETVERVFECGQRRRETSHAAIAEMVSRRSGSGNRGIARARAFSKLLVDDGHVNHSEMETRFYQILRREGLPLPARQCVVFRGDGRFAFADYAYHGVDDLIELLGFRWHSSSVALTANVERSNDIQLQRKRVLQFTWTHVTRRQPYVVEKVVALLRDVDRT